MPWTREFLGYDDSATVGATSEIVIEGRIADPATLPYLMDAGRRLRFVFDVSRAWEQPARLRLHTADQSDTVAPQTGSDAERSAFRAEFSTGLGIQKLDPAHLAFPQTAVIDLPGGTLVRGRNSLDLRVRKAGWFTWDAIDLIKTSG